MADRTRLEVYQEMLTLGVVPLFHHNDPDVASEIVDALVAGGCRIIEFTNRGVAAHEVFAALERRCRDRNERIVLGAGSVVDAATAALYINLGAAFVVGPTFDPEIARTCHRRKVAYIPGCATASEIGAAEEAGCEIVKIFPADALGGPSFVKAIRGPMPWSRIMPTGGIEPDEGAVKAWFEAGAACLGVGSGLVSRSIVATRDWAELAARATDLRELAARHLRTTERGD